MPSSIAFKSSPSDLPINSSARRKLFSISFFLEAGRINEGCSIMCLMRLFAYLPILKKYASSSAGFTSLPQSGHLPSTSWASVQKLSHGVQ